MCRCIDKINGVNGGCWLKTTECSQRDSVGVDGKHDELYWQLKAPRDSCGLHCSVSLVGVWSMVPSWSTQCQPLPPGQPGPPASLPAHLLLQWEAACTPLRLDGHNMAPLINPFILLSRGEERQHSEMSGETKWMEWRKMGEHMPVVE